jgi:hypothetical protein
VENKFVVPAFLPGFGLSHSIHSHDFLVSICPMFSIEYILCCPVTLCVLLHLIHLTNPTYLYKHIFLSLLMGLSGDLLKIGVLAMEAYPSAKKQPKK